MPPGLMLSIAILNTYLSFFGALPATNDSSKLEFQSWDYYEHIYFGPQEDIIDRAAALSGNGSEVDSVLEYALASYFSPTIISIRPARATEMLPVNNKNSALILTYATLKELAEVKYFRSQDTAAIGRYEGMIQFIQNRHGLTRAEINNHYREALTAEVRAVLDEEFNKISFVMGSPTGGYNATLTRNAQNGHYTLRYTDARNNTGELSAPTLDALLSAMQTRANRAIFNQNGINAVREQAALLPAVATPAATKDGLVNLVVTFYLNPNRNTAEAIRARHDNLWRESLSGEAAANSFSSALYTLNPDLARIVGE